MNLDDALKTIPPGSIFVSYGKDVISKFISWFYLLKHPELIGKTLNASHVGIYWGSGKHETVETIPGKMFGVIPWVKVAKGDFKDNLAKSNTIHVFNNTHLTVQTMTLLRAYSYGSVGRSYDFPAFAHFGFNNFKPADDADICVENVVDTWRLSGLPMLNRKKSYDIHPRELLDYLLSEEGKYDGYYEVFKFENGKLIYP